MVLITFCLSGCFVLRQIEKIKEKKSIIRRCCPLACSSDLQEVIKVWFGLCLIHPLANSLWSNYLNVYHHCHLWEKKKKKSLLTPGLGDIFKLSNWKHLSCVNGCGHPSKMYSWDACAGDRSRWVGNKNRWHGEENLTWVLIHAARHPCRNGSNHLESITETSGLGDIQNIMSIRLWY